MTYLLKHYFDPDFDHTRLKPREVAGGRVDHYDLGYVQNVVPGQVLAEFHPLEPEELHEDVDTRHIHDHKRFPLGDNTRVNPDNLDQLLADEHGYVFYDQDGRISVKRLLNIRGDVDFATGNVLFVGDLVVHGTVKDSFRAKGRNVLVKGHVQAAEVSSRGSLICESGIKGKGSAVVESGRSMRLAFAEHASLVSGENVLIEGNCLHNRIHAGRKLAVRGRMVGGLAYAYTMVWVGGMLGGGMNTTTQIVAGYDPALLILDQRLTAKIARLEKQGREYRRYADKNEDLAREFGPKIEACERKLVMLRIRKARVWEKIVETERLDECRISVPGELRPGVEISIGTAFLKIQDYLQNVHFYHHNNEVRVASPALAE